MNFVDLETTDLLVEVRAMFEATDAPAMPDLMEVVAGVLRHDLVVQRGYTYSVGQGGRLPCPVAVIGWDSTTLCRRSRRWRDGSGCADTEFLELSGGHFSYFDWPSPLTEVLQDRLTHARSAYGEGA